MLCLQERERESNFSGMSHTQRDIGCVRESRREKDKVKDEWRLCVAVKKKAQVPSDTRERQRRER